MQTAIQILGYGGLLPALLACGLTFLLVWLLPATVSKRYTSALSCGTAFAIGYALLPEWAPILPQRHWQWLPPLALVAMLVGPIALAAGLSRLERWTLFAALGALAGWALVPSWSRLEPHAPYMAGVIAGVTLLAMALDLLADRASPRIFAGSLMVSALLAAAVVGALQSLKYGQIAGIFAAALAGCAVAEWFGRGTRDVRGLVLLYTTVVGGIAFIACIGHDPVSWWMLILPLPPLLLWIVPKRSA